MWGLADLINSREVDGLRSERTVVNFDDQPSLRRSRRALLPQFPGLTADDEVAGEPDPREGIDETGFTVLGFGFATIA